MRVRGDSICIIGGSLVYSISSMKYERDGDGWGWLKCTDIRTQATWKNYEKRVRLAVGEKPSPPFMSVARRVIVNWRAYLITSIHNLSVFSDHCVESVANRMPAMQTQKTPSVCVCVSLYMCNLPQNLISMQHNTQKMEQTRNLIGKLGSKCKRWSAMPREMQEHIRPHTAWALVAWKCPRKDEINSANRRREIALMALFLEFCHCHADDLRENVTIFAQQDMDWCI